jgi:6-phosphogluconate dehydrogenase
MVHYVIEHSDMQLIAETYNIPTNLFGHWNRDGFAWT